MAISEASPLLHITPPRVAEKRLEEMAEWGARGGFVILLACMARMIALITVGEKRENLLIPNSFGNDGIILLIPFMFAALTLVWGSIKMLTALCGKTAMKDIGKPEDPGKSNPYHTARLFLAGSSVLFGILTGVLLGNPHQDAGKVVIGTLSLLAGIYAAAMAATPAVVNGWRASCSAKDVSSNKFNQRMEAH